MKGHSGKKRHRRIDRRRPKGPGARTSSPQHSACPPVSARLSSISASSVSSCCTSVSHRSRLSPLHSATRQLQRSCVIEPRVNRALARRPWVRIKRPGSKPSTPSHPAPTSSVFNTPRSTQAVPLSPKPPDHCPSAPHSSPPNQPHRRKRREPEQNILKHLLRQSLQNPPANQHPQHHTRHQRQVRHQRPRIDDPQIRAERHFE